MDFVYHVFTRITGDSCRGRLRSLSLFAFLRCDVNRTILTPFVPWLHTSGRHRSPDRNCGLEPRKSYHVIIYQMNCRRQEELITHPPPPLLQAATENNCPRNCPGTDSRKYLDKKCSEFWYFFQEASLAQIKHRTGCMPLSFETRKISFTWQWKLQVISVGFDFIADAYTSCKRAHIAHTHTPTLRWKDETSCVHGL